MNPYSGTSSLAKVRLMPRSRASSRFAPMPPRGCAHGAHRHTSSSLHTGRTAVAAAANDTVPLRCSSIA